MFYGTGCEYTVWRYEVKSDNRLALLCTGDVGSAVPSGAGQGHPREKPAVGGGGGRQDWATELGKAGIGALRQAASKPGKAGILGQMMKRAVRGGGGGGGDIYRTRLLSSLIKE
jgi:hypothetical protein